MAKRKEDRRKGFGKLLDAWIPPKDAGMPIGCVATSFTFSSSFFEEECLSRFLGLETDPTEDGPLYLIEREEKLSQVLCACAVVDQHHCKGPRSLRWDLLPARVSGGILHAKISLLVWSNALRVVIASANLTEDGYRRNLEVFGSFDYRENGEHSVRLLQEVIEFLRLCADCSQTNLESLSPPLKRVHAFLDKVRKLPPDWGRTDEDTLRKGLAVFPILVEPSRPPVLEALTQVWLSRTPPSDAYVFSPFFDPPGAPNLPAQALWKCLRKRGNVTVSFCLGADDAPDGRVSVRAPKSLLKAQPSDRRSETFIHRITLEATRPLHAKGISLDDNRWSLFMIGSSNFTSAGLGVNSARNLEANVAFLVDSDRQPQMAEALDAAFPPNDALDVDTIKWQGTLESEDDVMPEDAALPKAFGAATYSVDENERATIVLSFVDTPQSSWSVMLENDDEMILTDQDWIQVGRPTAITCEWKRVRPPSGFWVSLESSGTRAWWPVNVESSSTLPPPDELRSLSLEVLIDILTSARPLHRVLSAYLKRKEDRERLPIPESIVDPHKRVDTSQFLLQRTRRVSWALRALRDRLERPVATEEGLHWRLYGPVGVRALIAALIKEGQSPEEKAFLLSELALELARVRPTSFPGHLPVARVKSAIHGVITELQGAADVDLDGKAANLKAYVQEVFRTVLT